MQEKMEEEEEEEEALNQEEDQEDIRLKDPSREDVWLATKHSGGGSSAGGTVSPPTLTGQPPWGTTASQGPTTSCRGQISPRPPPLYTGVRAQHDPWDAPDTLHSTTPGPRAGGVWLVPSPPACSM